MTIVIAVLLGLAAGALGAVFLLRPALRERQARLEELTERERDLTADAIERERELADARARLEASEAALDTRVREAILAASQEAYGRTNAALVEMAGARLGQTVAPLRESLEKVTTQVQELDRARAQSHGAITRQLSELGERTQTLANALRSPHVRGRWGEIQLKRVVELAGMLPYCDFAEQVTATGEEGRLRPDLIVRLPGGRQVVVDAKVPLAAYLDALEAMDEDVRAARLADHARRVREHLQKLSAKQYWQQFADSPDYVVMFLPDEGFFRAAWEQDRELVELGVRARVHIASPTTLIALLQAIAYGWQQEKVAEDARAVQQLGQRLYESMSVLGGHLAKVGTGLDRAVTSYNEAVGSLERRVLPPARKLADHVVSDKEIAGLDPVGAQSRPLAAPELTIPAEQAPLEVLPGTRDAA